MATTPFLIVNGISWPCPVHGFSYTWATIVDAARNANGAQVGQVVGRQIVKLDTMEWKGLRSSEWENMLRSLEPFYVNVTFYDPAKRRNVTVVMYPGDRSATPLFLYDGSRIPEIYESCKVNLIDCGL
jgi:hypothetical protein